MKHVLSILCILTVTALKSQDLKNDKVEWTRGSTWQEIVLKARRENKLIFVDCYATWCGPCKSMDKEVYTSPDVGKELNDRFISIKVQMDKTINDDEHLRKWYDESKLIQEKYNVCTFPTFFFFFRGWLCIA